MNNNIEDIYIGANRNINNKKSKKGLLFFIIFLFIILIGMIVAYWYFTKYKTVSTKQLFFEHLATSNVKEITSENMYKELSSKLLNSNYELNSTINFSTNDETQSFDGRDINNFTFNLKNQKNVEDDKTFSELGIDYSGNEIFKADLITDSLGIAIYDGDVVNNHVGVHYEKLKELYNLDFDKDRIDKLFKTEKIDLTEDEINKFISDNISKIAEKLPEEKFTIQENFAINQNDKNISVTGYTLKLSQEELNSILVDTLKDLRNNEEFLKKFINETEPEEIPQVKVTVPSVVPIDDNEEESEINQQEENMQENPEEEPIKGETNEFNTEQFIEDNSEENFDNEQQEDLENVEQEENINEEQTTGTQELELTNITNLEPVNETTTVDLEKLNKIYEYEDIVKFILGLKINKNLEELQEEIDSFITKVDNLTGNGLTVTVYASNEKAEKISIVLPNENTIDLEVLKKDDIENKLKITYLYKGKNPLLNFETDNELETELIENETNGYSIEIDKISNTSNTSFDLLINFIENEKINKKINIKSDFEGSINSNSVKNNFIITFSTKENESKFSADTNIKFTTKGAEIQSLTDENCLFLDNLSEEDYNLTIQAIKEKIELVKLQKNDKLNFIDTNTGRKQDIDKILNNITRSDAQKLLEAKISSMRNEAQENQQEFTIQNLENLQIDGYEVSSAVTENSAIIAIDIYTFKVDSEFNITNN